MNFVQSCEDFYFLDSICSIYACQQHVISMDMVSVITSNYAGTLARETTPVAKWMVTWRGNFTWPLGSHSQVATGARQHLSTLADQQSVATPSHDTKS